MNHLDINMTLRYMKLSEANKVSTVEGIYYTPKIIFATSI